MGCSSEVMLPACYKSRKLTQLSSLSTQPLAGGPPTNFLTAPETGGCEGVVSTTATCSSSPHH